MIYTPIVPVLLCAVITVLLSSFWYHPRIFGGVWMRLTTITPEQAEQGKRRMWVYMLLAFLSSMFVAYVMAYVGIALGVSSVPQALWLGCVCWVGFTAPPMLGMVLWEQKPLRAYLIVSLYWLTAFILMALTLFYTSVFSATNLEDMHSGISITAS